MGEAVFNDTNRHEVAQLGSDKDTKIVQVSINTRALRVLGALKAQIPCELMSVHVPKQDV